MLVVDCVGGGGCGRWWLLLVLLLLLLLLVVVHVCLTPGAHSDSDPHLRKHEEGKWTIVRDPTVHFADNSCAMLSGCSCAIGIVD